MTRARIRFFILLVVLLAGVIAAHAKEWRGLTPLKSTRADVERLLGKPDSDGGYELGSEYAYVYYAPRCSRLHDCRCVVDPDTVLSISVNVKNNLHVSQLGTDLSSFRKTRDKHLLVYDYYTSKKEGVTYTVFREDGLVTHIDYFVSDADCKATR